MCYLASAVLSPYSLLGSAILPWWSWGLFIALNYLHNVIHLKRQSGGISFAISNLLFFLVFGIGGLGYLQQTLSGRFWPNSIMNIVVAFIVVLALSYSFYRPPSEKQHIQLWEIGIILSSYGAFLASQYLDIPYIYILPLIIIASGLIQQGLRPRTESEGVIRSTQGSNRFSIGMILLFIASVIALLSLLGLASNKSIGEALNSFITSIIAFYNQFGQETLNKSPKLLELIKYSTAITPSTTSYGTTAPLWFMMILWILLAFSVLLLIIYAFIRVYEFIQFLKVSKLDLGTRNVREGFSLVPTLRMFIGNLRIWVTLIGQKTRNLARLLSFQIGISPRDIKGLYSYFLWWGGFTGLKRKSNQTPREYQEELSQRIPELNYDLVLGIDRLTISYERYSYGGDSAPLTVKEIKEVYETLAKFRKVIRGTT
jgi:hypothetical protein